MKESEAFVHIFFLYWRVSRGWATIPVVVDQQSVSNGIFACRDVGKNPSEQGLRLNIVAGLKRLDETLGR